MLSEGVDLDEPGVIEAWMQGFNALSYDERAAILTDEIVGRGSPLGAFPEIPVELPTEDEARASAADAPLLSQISRLAEFFGTGRKLTQKGHPTLADARELVALLDTGDRIDEWIGDRQFKTKSAADLPRLSLVVRLATKAQFVRKAKGQLIATKAGMAIGQDPLADLARLVTAIDDVGMVSARTAGGRFVWSTLAPFFDDMFVPLTTMLVTDDSPARFDEIVDLAFAEFEDEIDLDNPHWTIERRRDLVESQMATAIGTLERAGLVAWASETVELSYGSTKRAHGTVDATPAGRWVLTTYLVEDHDQPLVIVGPPQLTELTFEELVTAAEEPDGGDFVRFARELKAWIDHRGDDAPRELADAARQTDDPAVRGLALAAMADLDVAVSAPLVRSLLDAPAARGSAIVWLVEHEFEPAATLADPDPRVVVDVLATMMVTHGPEGLVEVLEAVGSHAQQAERIQGLWRQSNPATPFVLEAIGQTHPTKVVAKAARKAAMQHRTWLAAGER